MVFFFFIKIGLNNLYSDKVDQVNTMYILCYGDRS